MEERMHNILRQVKQFTSFTPIEGQEAVFEVTTKLSDSDHKTWVRFEFTGNVIRVHLSHGFGCLNLSRGLDANRLLRLLVENRGSFRNSCGYLAVQPVDSDLLITSLEANLHFLQKWDDQDIAEMIGLQFYDMYTSFWFGPWPDSIEVFDVQTAKEIDRRS